MQRFRKNEITVERVVAAIRRRVSNIPDRATWSWWNQDYRTNVRKLQGYRNIHLGKRCFIIGNGPSLKKMDLSLLNDEYSFGMNRIYLLFDSHSFTPSYYVATNEQVLEQFSGDISSIDIPKFLNWNSRKFYSNSSSNQKMVNYLNISYRITDKFAKDIRNPISGGGTVTFAAMQIAYWMGFREVILIGVDHSFVEKGTPNTVEVRTQEHDKSHFDPNYFPKGVEWQLPDLRRSELAYLLAKNAYEANGGRILDATVNGKLEIFPKKDFYKILEKP